MDWSLPAELAAGASVRGEEYGWEIACFPAALATAERLELACLGGQFQFRFDDAVYEMYWLSADPTERLAGEAWTAYLHRCCSEVAKEFNRLVATTDFSVVVRELPSETCAIRRRQMESIRRAFLSSSPTSLPSRRLLTSR